MRENSTEWQFPSTVYPRETPKKWPLRHRREVRDHSNSTTPLGDVFMEGRMRKLLILFGLGPVSGVGLIPVEEISQDRCGLVLATAHRG